jgi:hypothetical protein
MGAMNNFLENIWEFLKILLWIGGIGLVIFLSFRNDGYNESYDNIYEYQLSPREEVEPGTDTIYWRDSVFIVTVKIDTTYLKSSNSIH